MKEWRVFRFLDSFKKGKRIADRKTIVRIINNIKVNLANIIMEKYYSEELHDPKLFELSDQIAKKYPLIKRNKSILKQSMNAVDVEQKQKQIIDAISLIVDPEIIFEFFLPSLFNDIFNQYLTGYFFLRYENTFSDIISIALTNTNISFNKSQQIKDEEVEDIKNQLKLQQPNLEAPISVGDEVRLLSSSKDYPGFLGRVRAIKEDRLDVDVFIFDTEVLVNLHISDVERIHKNHQL